MNRRLHLIAVIAAIAAIVTGVNLLAATGLRGVRADFTERGLYRLNAGTLETIDAIDEPVRWTFYYSRRVAADYPAIRAYGARVRELLSAYAARSGGMVRLQEIDPEPFSPEEDAALAAGLAPAPAGEGAQIFFGLVAHDSVDQTRTIAYFPPEREALLEYELTRMLAELQRPRAPVLAVLTGLSIQPDAPGSRPNRFAAELAARYGALWVDPNFDALPDADALLLLHPPVLSQAQLYLIDQFILRTGRAVVFLDPMSHSAMRAGPDGLPPVTARRASDLPRLLDAWGVVYDPTRVAMDRMLGLPVQVTEDGRTRLRSYPLWFSTGQGELSRRDLATAGLTRGLNFGSPGVFVRQPGLSRRFETLATTSLDGAMTLAATAASNPSPDTLLRDYEAEDSPLILAARIGGALTTAFPDGPPAGLPPEAYERPHLTASATAADIALVADSDLLDDMFYTRDDAALGASTVADNLAFALNLVDLALGDPALVGLRSRERSDRPMARVDRLRAQAEARYVEEQTGLQTLISEAEARLAVLQNPSITLAAGESADPADVRAEIASLRQRVIAAEDRLREVERGFRTDIDALEAGLRFWTIWFPPLLVGAGALGAVFLRRRRRS